MRIILTFIILLIKTASYSQLNSGLVINSLFDGNIDNSITSPNNSFYGVPSFTNDRSNSGSNCALMVDRTNYLKTDYKIQSNNTFSFSFYFKIDKPKQYGIILGRQPALAINNDTLQFVDWFSYNKAETVLQFGNWYHVAFTFDGKTMAPFINGVSIGSYKLVNYFDAFFYIGNSQEFSIDDLKIYNRVLSISEINQLYNLPSSCIITALSLDQSGDYKVANIIYFTDLLGKEIGDISNYSGIYIVGYSDGTKKKILK